MKQKKNKLIKLAIMLGVIFTVVFFNMKVIYGVSIYPKTEGGKKICNTATIMLTYMHNNPTWHYKSGSNINTWNKAKEKKLIACGSFVSVVFQEAGFCKKGKYISHGSSARIVKSRFGGNSINCEWIEGHSKKLKDIDDLQAGDCVIFAQTIAIFAAKQNSNYYLYICIDSDATNRCINKKGPITKGSFKDWKVYWIVRPKGNQITSGDQMEIPSDPDESQETGGTTAPTDIYQSQEDEETVLGALGSMFRNFWISMTTLFENNLENRNDATVMYSFWQTDSVQETGESINTGDFIQYYQGDYGNVNYGSGSIASCGCGPTSFAMVATAISGTKITPKDAVAWCGNKYYISGAGTDWAYFNAAKEHFNLNCKLTTTTSINEVCKALRNKALVISSQGPGLFTKHGHFIVLSGIEGDGRIIVKDPNKANAVTKGYNNRKFTKNEISAAAKNYWIFKY